MAVTFSAFSSYMFPTMVVGSLPRPQWIRDVIQIRKSGGISHRDAETVLDDAIPSAIRMQERSGLDYISDGEWRRESYVKVFAESVSGFKDDLIEGSPGNTSSLKYPAVVSPIKLERPIAVDEAEFLIKNTMMKTIVAIPSPYTIARRMWSPVHSVGAYPTRLEFMEACIPIVRSEIHRLAVLGVNAIQLDDPWLALLVDPKYREREEITDIDQEIQMSIRSVNEVADSVEGIPISVHLCHAHFNRRHGTSGPYDIIMDGLGEMKVERFAMEFATPDAGGIEVLKKFPNNKVLGLGVIDHTDKNIETPEDVVSRAEAAMEFVPKERLTLNPDCGFSPSSANPMDLDEAYLKLKSMCEGARLLRDKHG